MKTFKLFGLTFRKITKKLYYSHAGFEIYYNTLLKGFKLYWVNDYFDGCIIKMPLKGFSKDTISLLETTESLEYLLKQRRKIKGNNYYNPALEDLKCLDKYEILL